MIYIFGPRSKPLEGLPTINVTSRSRDWGRAFSPFLLGPVDLYDGHIAERVENAWQFTKVYPEHVDNENNPTRKYWDWAELGWSNRRAERYPMGKGAKPLYSLWDNERLTYVEARKRIYIPLYAKCVRQISAWQELQAMHEDQETFGMWDFDGYNHHELGMTLEQVKDDPKRKMGHAFVLVMMLEGFV